MKADAERICVGATHGLFSEDLVRHEAHTDADILILPVCFRFANRWRIDALNNKA